MLNLVKMLLNDERLKEKVGAHIYPISTDYLGECILYNFHTMLEDKISQRLRLQITIIADSMANALSIEKEVKRILLTVGDDNLTKDILQVVLNGGGTLEDVEREKHHRILYFDIIKRSDTLWQ